MPVLKVKSGATEYLNRRLFKEYQEWCRGSFQVFVGDTVFSPGQDWTNGPTGFNRTLCSWSRGLSDEKKVRGDPKSLNSNTIYYCPRVLGKFFYRSLGELLISSKLRIPWCSYSAHSQHSRVDVFSCFILPQNYLQFHNL